MIMMTELKKQNLIKKEKLNPTYYFQSLLQQATRLKLLTDAEFEHIQLQSFQLLAKQTEQYTGGESSSVKIETAQSLLASIFYTIGIYLKNFPDADRSIEVLKQSPLSELYRHGKKLLKSKFANAEQLLDAVRNNCLVTDHCAYNDTIRTGLPLFFSNYDIDFAAQDIPASIDYPLSNDQMDLAGVEYIYNYLQILFWENQFCNKFPEGAIHSLLRGYHNHYRDLLINIFGLVLTNAVACVLADKKAAQLNIEPSERQYLYHTLIRIPKDNLTAVLRDASTKLCKELNISNRFLQKHISATASALPAGIKNALENNNLDSLFISFKEKHTQSVIQFKDHEKMPDELFRSIADEIRECRYVSDKITIIRREIHSIADLVDLLEGYCLFDDEFAQVFQALDDMELALLLKKLPKYLIDTDLHFTENEKEWQNKLKYFFEELDSARRDKIRELADKIDLG